MSLTDDQNERLTEILATLGPMAHTLTGASPGFVSDMVQKHERYGEDIRVSPKQWEWLESLYEKAGGKPTVAGKMRDDETDEEPTPEMDDEIPF